jgi:2',3'-cyclic-nucleotide 2'-phosphodiesterase (5'-nucleotidase family)
MVKLITLYYFYLTAGGFFYGSPFYSFFRGGLGADIMRRADYDVVALAATDFNGGMKPV